MHVGTYVHMYVSTHVRMTVCVCAYGCLCIYVLMYVRMYVCMLAEALISAIMAIHHQARLEMGHAGHQKDVGVLNGLRHGCSLSPVS